MQPIPLSVLTWNINFRTAESLDPLAALPKLPDVVTLQEVKLDHADAVKDRLKGMGYSLCMLRAGLSSLNSSYRDPYLLAIWRELDDPSVVEDKWFSGYESEPRRLPLTQSGTAIRCVPAGFELTPPEANFAELFAAACVEIGSDVDNLVELSQAVVDGHRVDTVDRIQVGADIVRSLVAAGL